MLSKIILLIWLCWFVLDRGWTFYAASKSDRVRTYSKRSALFKIILLILLGLLVVVVVKGCTFYTATESDIDACSLVTETEIETILGVEAKQIRASSFGSEEPVEYKQARCAYNITLREGLSYHSTSMFVEIDSVARFEEYKLHFVKVNDPTHATAPQTVKSDAIAIYGIGQGAVWVPLQEDGFDESYIAFMKNDHAVKIEIPFVRNGIAEIEAAKQLARVASVRIP